MTIRNLDFFFSPASVALVGASRKSGSVGDVIARNILDGGYGGQFFPVNPQATSIRSHRAYPNVASLPLAPDLAIIATPPGAVPKIIAALGALGTKAAVVITAGFAELGADGRKLQEDMLAAARPHLLRIVGPNCLGVLSPFAKLNASFSHIAAAPGDIALISQSGAVVTSVLDWAQARGIGFSHVVSFGAMSDVDVGDMLDYLARDPKARSIVLYLEAATAARKFMSAARAAARQKPIIVIKAGRHEAAARAAASHTGALAGSDAVYDAAFARAGMVRILGLEDLFDAIETLARMKVAPKGDRLAILTNGGGVGVLAADRIGDGDGRLAELGDSTLEKLGSLLPKTWSHGNPVDIIGDAPPERYAGALDAVLADDAVDAVLVMNCPTAVADSLLAAEAVIARYNASGRRKPLLAAWLGAGAAARARQRFAESNIPCYDTPGAAVDAFLLLAQYSRHQNQLLAAPPALVNTDPEAVSKARPIIDQALAEDRVWLSEAEAKAVLSAYGVPVVETRIAKTVADALRAADEIGYPVALKILSPDITHKTDVGGVALNIADAAALRREVEAMALRVAQAEPKASLEGFTVQRMARQSDAHELILGLSEDPTFGPVVLFGHGGIAVEARADRALALPPLDLKLAREMMKRTRIHRLLEGYRDRAPADLDAIAQALVRVSEIAATLPEIKELDVNPLWANEKGVVALDARMRVAPADPRASPDSRLAIRPYPEQLRKEVEDRQGARYLVRAILPSDAPAITAMLARCAPADLQIRFLEGMKDAPSKLAERISQIDYDREIALAAFADPTATQIAGVARLVSDPDRAEAEFAIIVQTDRQGRGLGWRLMEVLIAYARTQAIGRLVGEIGAGNSHMRDMCADLGFAFTPIARRPQFFEASLSLH